MMYIQKAAVRILFKSVIRKILVFNMHFMAICPFHYDGTLIFYRKMESQTDK